MSYLQRRKDAFRYAGKGIWEVITKEAHAKIHILASVIAVGTGGIIGLSATEWCLVCLCIGAVFMAEAFNSAIERLADRVTTDRDPLIAAVKDIAAGAVLFISIAAAAVGFIIFLPKLF